ncbi:hypothetical protein CVT24_009516 [Panaeolus cyanescens]|uniref:Uncharacterized protein n=1 Tax=Panaeolus cyanescens TaxID=181874 RepID=A0A409VYF3_9AGAR|nr:hypothetical protein CVT24_009516 [Panaeolus cyanescens]
MRSRFTFATPAIDEYKKLSDTGKYELENDQDDSKEGGKEKEENYQMYPRRMPHAAYRTVFLLDPTPSTNS